VNRAALRIRPAVKLAASDDAVAIAERVSCGSVVALANESGAEAWVLCSGAEPAMVTLLAGRPAGATAGATRLSVCESRPTVRETSRAVEVTVSVVG
jgi:hypothetical protein